jgi:hypothetical protein
VEQRIYIGLQRRKKKKHLSEWDKVLWLNFIFFPMYQRFVVKNNIIYSGSNELIEHTFQGEQNIHQK